MKGTEKQVAWAEEIKENLVKTIDEGIMGIKNMDADPTQKEKAITLWEKRKNAIVHAEYAGDLINIFKGIDFGNDSGKIIGAIAAAYKIVKPVTDGEKEILCK